MEGRPPGRARRNFAPTISERSSCGSRSRPPAGCGGPADDRARPAPERSLLRAPRLAEGGLDPRHSTASITSSCRSGSGPRCVNGSRAQVPQHRACRRRRPVAASPLSSSRPQARAGEATAQERLERRRRRLRAARRAESRSSGTSRATARSRRPSGRGMRSSVERRTAAGRLEQLQQRARRRPASTHRRAARAAPDSATSTSASPSSRSLSGARSRSELKNWVFAVYRPSRQKAASSSSPGRALVARSGRRATPVHDADNAGSWPSVRCPPTTSTPISAAAQAIPSSTASACARSGLTSMSTSPSGRPPIARTSETFVTTAAAPAACGLLRTNAGWIASPHTIRYSSPCAIAAPSSPSGGAPSRRRIARSRLACRAGESRRFAASC